MGEVGRERALPDAGPVTPLRWFLRAAWVALRLVTAFGALGFLVSWWSPTAGFALAGVASLFGAGWAVERLGGAGLGAAALGLVAALGASKGGNEWWVARRARPVDLTSLQAWPEGALAVRLPAPVLHAPEWRERAWWRSGSGKNAVAQDRVATPLRASRGGPVVAFACHEGVEVPDGDGAVLVSWAAWTGSAREGCAPPIRKAAARSVAGGGVVAPGAEERVVRVFADEAALRAAPGLGQALGVAGGGLALYVVLCAAFMRQGARAVDPGA